MCNDKLGKSAIRTIEKILFGAVLAGVVIPSFFISPVHAAKFPAQRRIVAAALAAGPEPSASASAFLHQPTPPMLRREPPGYAMVLSASGLVAPLAPTFLPVSAGSQQGAGGSDDQGIVLYTVEPGDTVSSIAAQFGITTQTLLWANKLTERSPIRAGQELIILPVSGVQHKVRSGETIGMIARKYQADVNDIIDFNDLPESGDIFVGDTLIVPGGKIIAPPPPPPTQRSYPRAPHQQVASGYFMMPTAGRNWGRLHAYNGVDIANACGTPVYASAPGTVILADPSGWNGGYGGNVRIRHPNGVVTLYAHLQKVLTHNGAGVAQGDLVGYMGTTGRSTGCHLHFEIRGAKNPFAR